MKTFIPHGHCFRWDETILLLEIGGNLLACLSYIVIPFVLWRMLVIKPDMSKETRRFILLFGMFIITCGIGHGIKVYNIWNGLYLLEGIVNMLTGVISFTTAVYILSGRTALDWVPSKESYKELINENRELRDFKKKVIREKFKEVTDKINKE